MATLTQNVIDNDGVVSTLVAASGGGDKAVPGDGAYLEVLNGSGSSITVTIATPEVVDGSLAVADRAVAVGAGVRTKIALPAELYEQADGLAWITYSSATTVTVGSFRA